MKVPKFKVCYITVIFQSLLPNDGIITHSGNDATARWCLVPEDLSIPGIPDTPQQSKEHKRP